jgi:5-methylthioadenosine/S-adenosylhomocysteine deaminase
MNFDLIIEAGTLVTCDDNAGWVLENKSIAIKDGMIVAVEDSTPSTWAAKNKINAKSRLVMPGLVNAHAHLPMNFFRGLADDLPFEEWLFKYILPLEARLVAPDFVRIGTELATLELLSMGVTTVCDMYYFEDVIADVLDKAGLRACVGESVADFPMPDCKEAPKNNYKILDRMRERYQGHARIKPVLAPHAPYSCSDETLKEAMRYADKFGMDFTIHVSETKNEVEESFKKFGMSPVKRLWNLGFMQHKSIFAHGVHLSDEDIELIAKSPVGISYNPESNMKLGSGTTRVPELLKRGIKLGLGTDSVASNNDLNLFKEMDVGAKLQKLSNHDNTALTAKECLKMATFQGAEALNIPNVGKIKSGYCADLIILDMRKPWLEPRHDVLAQLVYACNGSEVETVICHGEVLMENKKYLKSDLEKTFSEASAYRRSMQF